MKRWDEAARRLPTDRDTVAVEVGVWKGQMSEKLLALRPLLTLYLVDLWRAGKPGESWYMSGSQMARQSKHTVDAAYRRVHELTERVGQRARIIRAYSTVAADLIEDASVDLVFLDADHSQLAVQADIQAWTPKVKPGGVIGGHDYGSPRFPGVKDAVLMSFRPSEIETGDNSTWWVKR